MVPGTKAPLPAGRALAAPRPATSRSPRAALAPAARAPDPAAPAPVRGPSSPPPPALPPSSSRPGRADVAAAIRTIPDFPKRGVRFFDVSTLCLDPRAFRCCIDLIAERYRGAGVQCVAGERSGAARGGRLGVCVPCSSDQVPLCTQRRLSGHMGLPGYCVTVGDRDQTHGCTPRAALAQALRPAASSSARPWRSRWACRL